MINTSAEKEIHYIWVTLKYELLSFSNGLSKLWEGGLGGAEMTGESGKQLPVAILYIFWLYKMN